MTRFILLTALAAGLFVPAACEAGPLRDRIANRFRPTTAITPKPAPAAPVAKTMPKPAGQSPTCCCKDCQCNKTAAK